jgi:hypothetical protein
MSVILHSFEINPSTLIRQEPSFMRRTRVQIPLPQLSNYQNPSTLICQEPCIAQLVFFMRGTRIQIPLPNLSNYQKNKKIQATLISLAMKYSCSNY